MDNLETNEADNTEKASGQEMFERLLGHAERLYTENKELKAHIANIQDWVAVLVLRGLDLQATLHKALVHMYGEFNSYLQFDEPRCKLNVTQHVVDGTELTGILDGYSIWISTNMTALHPLAQMCELFIEVGYTRPESPDELQVVAERAVYCHIVVWEDDLRWIAV
jgi:hypothetical protein